MSQLIYHGPVKHLKSVRLGRVRISPFLLEALDKYCKENGESNRSVVVRRAIRNEINRNSISDIIKDERPFMPHKQKEATEQ